MAYIELEEAINNKPSGMALPPQNNNPYKQSPQNKMVHNMQNGHGQ